MNQNLNLSLQKSNSTILYMKMDKKIDETTSQQTKISKEISEPNPIKKKRKKKKSFRKMMKELMKPKHTHKEKQELHKQKLQTSLGGGIFEKMEKI